MAELHGETQAPGRGLAPLGVGPTTRCGRRRSSPEGRYARRPTSRMRSSRPRRRRRLDRVTQPARPGHRPPPRSDARRGREDRSGMLMPSGKPIFLPTMYPIERCTSSTAISPTRPPSSVAAGHRYARVAFVDPQVEAADGEEPSVGAAGRRASVTESRCRHRSDRRSHPASHRGSRPPGR